MINTKFKNKKRDDKPKKCGKGMRKPSKSEILKGQKDHLEYIKSIQLASKLITNEDVWKYTLYCSTNEIIL